MTTPADPPKTELIPSPAENKPSPPQEDDDPKASLAEKYARLEDLLRQTLALAGEISETKTPLKPVEPYTAGGMHAHLPGECIVLRRTTEQPARGAASFDVRRRSSASYPRRTGSGSSSGSNNNNGNSKRRKVIAARTRSTTVAPVPGSSSDDSELDDSAIASSSASVGSAFVQEPFSPRSLVLSLDAVVEGNCPMGEELVCLDVGSVVPDSPPQTRAVVASPPPPPSTPAFEPTRGSSRPPPLLSHSIEEEEAEEEEGCRPRTPASPPAGWHVRIVPVAFGGSPGQETASGGSSSPALVKLEAVFPYRFFAADALESDSLGAETGWSSEGSYIIIGRRPPVVEGMFAASEGQGQGGDSVGGGLGDVVTDSEHG